MNVTDSRRAVSAATLLVGGLVANLGLYLLSIVVNAVVPGAWDSPWRHVELLGWFSIDLVLAVALFQLAGAVEDGLLLRLTAVAMLLSALLDLPSWLLAGSDSFGGVLAKALSVVGMMTLLVVRGLMTASFVQLTKERFSWVLPLLAVVIVFTVLKLGFNLATTLGVVSFEVYRSPAYRYVMPLVSFFNSGATLAAAIAVRSAVSGALERQPAAAVAGLVPAAPEPISPAADFLVGGIALAVGLGVTAISYSAASGGGKYVIATGAIAVGVVRIVRGLIRLAKGNPAA